MYLFIYLFSRYRLQIFIHNVTKLIISEFRNESKRRTKRRSEKKKKNANDSAMYRNFPLMLNRDILSLLFFPFSRT